MIKKELFFSGLLLFLFFSFACERQEKPLPEVIPFINLIAGQKDTLQLTDLLFLPEMEIKKIESPAIRCSLRDKSILMLDIPDSLKGFTYIRISLKQGGDFYIPIRLKETVPVTFSWQDDPGKTVFLIGSFNGWKRGELPLQYSKEKRCYSLTLYLEPGRYEYKFVVDAEELIDPTNPVRVDNGFGGYNSVLQVVSEYQQPLRILFHLAGDDETPLISVQGCSSKQPEFLVLLDNRLIPIELERRGECLYSLSLKRLVPRRGKHVLRIFARAGDRISDVLTCWIQDGRLLSDGSFIWQDAIIYFLMLDRFFDGDSTNNKPVKVPGLEPQANWQGGDLKGVLQKLEEGYFDSLGINTLWLSPVFQTTDSAYAEYPEPHYLFSGYHGYWPVNFKKVDPHFGNLEDFKRLVKAAHKRGIRVLLDFVSNHVHESNPLYREHPDWFGSLELPDGRLNLRLWDEYRLTTWFDTFLPTFDYLHSDEAVEAITEVAIWWLKETGIDGFRHDATKHIPYKFWRTLTRKIKTGINPDRRERVFQIGETYGNSKLIGSYVNNGMLDSQLDFEQYFTARRVFVSPRGNFRDLMKSILQSQLNYGYNHLMGIIMDSHDQVRMMAYFDGDLSLADDGREFAWKKEKISVDDTLSYRKALTYLAYLLSVPGIPIIYYGDEIGMTGAGDPDNRRFMRFSGDLLPQEQSYLEAVCQLIELRRRYAVLRRGDFQPLRATQSLLAFSRGLPGSRILVVINKSRFPEKVTFSLAELMGCRQLVSLVNGKILTTDSRNRITVTIQPHGYDLFLFSMDLP